ncbi:MAG: hypothetical protein ABSB74_18905, partial [Tepidisphaeraceae bacterium]
MKKIKSTKSSHDGLEFLEDRRLLSSAIIAGGNLELIGDANQSNTFLVRAAPSNRVLGFSNNFGRVASLSTVQTVVIYTGNETDTVTVGAGVTTPVEVISPTGTTTWLKAGTSSAFGAVGGGGSSGDGSTGTGAGSTGTGSGSAGTGTGSTGTGTGSKGTGTGSSGSGTGSTGSGTGSTGSGTGSKGTGGGSGSSGSGTGSSGSGSGSTGSGSGSTGSGSGSTGSGTGSTGSGSGSTGSGSGSTGSG